MDLLMKQEQQLSPQQLQSVRVLQMSAMELAGYLQELAMENPVIDLTEPASPAESEPEDDLLQRLQWLEDNDVQNRYYHGAEEYAETDALARVGGSGGLEETLERFLSRQLDRLSLDADMARLVRWLASCLDESGYLRFPPEELARDIGVPLPRLEEAIDLLRSLEPAGVGAADLSQCLALQLQRVGVSGTAERIVNGYLEELARGHYRNIAGKLGVPLDEVLAAQRVIRELEPRPGRIFEHPERVAYLVPDVFVEETEDGFRARLRGGGQPMLRINGYYRELLAKSEEPEVRDYLRRKLDAAQNVLRAIEQRESTLQRCAQAIVDRQAAFFRAGPQALRQLSMAEVADALAVHESTVSRAVREKYLQCVWGVFPLRWFFSRAVAEGAQEGGAEAARALLRRLIDEEDEPLSDQKLSERMAAAGYPISRRTVAKYRDELGIPSASARRYRAASDGNT